MKRLLLALALLSSVSALPSAGQRASKGMGVGRGLKKYIGLKVGASLPAGLRQADHFLLSSKGGVAIAAEYGLREVHKGGVRMLWLERLEGRDAAGAPTSWEVLDVLVLPPVGNNQVLAHSVCFIGIEFEPEVFAILDYEDKEYFRRARSAWRASRNTEKFEPTPVKGVRCANQGWGV